MSSNVFECKICLENFDSRDHRPLSLDCGHTFCEFCIRQMTSNNHKICATCRAPTTKPVDQLPVIYILIPSEEKPATHSNPAPVVDKCKDHGCVLDQFCAECGVTACRKCVQSIHVEHRIDFIDDILFMDPDAASLTEKLKNKIESKISNLMISISASLAISEKFSELQHCESGLEKWTDSLFCEKTLDEQHLEAWRDAKQKSSQEKCELFENLRHHWNEVDLTFLPIKELLSFTDKVEELGKCAADLKEIVRGFQGASKPKKSLNIDELYPNNGNWRVCNDDESQGAVASVRAGRTPLSLAVVTSPTAPIRQLHEVLDILGSACPVHTSVKQLDTFWAPSNTADSKRLLTFIEKFGPKVRVFYGSPHEVSSLCRVNPETIIGVRLASMDDIDLCLNLPQKPNSVSCVKSLPAVARDRMLELGWDPRKWHFPDLEPGNMDWMISLMTIQQRSDYLIYLPHCRLNEENFCLLLNKYSGKLAAIHCEQTDLSAPAKARLEFSGAQKSPKISFHWTISLDNV